MQRVRIYAPQLTLLLSLPGRLKPAAICVARSPLVIPQTAGRPAAGSSFFVLAVVSWALPPFFISAGRRTCTSVRGTGIRHIRLLRRNLELFNASIQIGLYPPPPPHTHTRACAHTHTHTQVRAHAHAHARARTHTRMRTQI